MGNPEQRNFLEEAAENNLKKWKAEKGIKDQPDEPKKKKRLSQDPEVNQGWLRKWEDKQD